MQSHHRPRSSDRGTETKVAGLIAYLSYFGASAAFLVLGLAAYVLVTPYHEFSLIRQGNTAAAYSLGGAVIGLSLPIASAVAHSVGIMDLAVWAAVASLTQMAVFLAVALLLPGFKAAIADDRVGYGIFLGAASIAIGALNAAALTY